MYIVKKDEITRQLTSDIQVSAFTANGWEIVKGDAPENSEQDVSGEISALKAEADALEIKYHPNIGAEKLREKIAEAKAE